MASKSDPPQPSSQPTQRISLGDLERLRAESRATKGLPSLAALQLMLGASLDDDDVIDLGLSEKKSETGTGVTASSRALGIEMAATRARVIETIFLHSEGHEKFHVWAGDLGKGLTFSSNPARVRAAHGAPSRSGTGWDRFDGVDGTVHFQYGDTVLRLVTLMAKGTAP
ncbi:MAG: hypothetical protein Q8O67_07955 [Deltaproteobacteria bacterium]|nr:hypothetical protein [Deltaproteobacteria bacterium]